MKISVVRIGNSKGIRIPKAILEQCQVRSEVDLKVLDGKIILDPSVRSPRSGWEDCFSRMAANNDDAPLIDDSIDLDAEDWEW